MKYLPLTLKLQSCLLMAVFTGFSARAESNFKWSLGAHYGRYGIHSERATREPEINFTSYMDAEGFYFDYIYIGFWGSLSYKDTWHAEAKVSMYSDLAPVLINLHTTYNFWGSLGVGASFMGYSQIFSDYSIDMYNNSGDFFYQHDPRYQNTYNSGVAIGPSLRHSGKRVLLTWGVHAGVRWQSTFREALHQKQPNSNRVRLIEYQTTTSPSAYLFPHATLQANLFRVGQTAVGLRATASAELSRRRVNFHKSVSEWTYNPTTQFVRGRRHDYMKTDFDFGITFSW